MGLVFFSALPCGFVLALRMEGAPFPRPPGIWRLPRSQIGEMSMLP